MCGLGVNGSAGFKGREPRRECLVMGTSKRDEQRAAIKSMLVKLGSESDTHVSQNP